MMMTDTTKTKDDVMPLSDIRDLAMNLHGFAQALFILNNNEDEDVPRLRFARDVLTTTLLRHADEVALALDRYTARTGA